MQSTGQTSKQASQPVQLSALITATSLQLLRAPDFAITLPRPLQTPQCLCQHYSRGWRPMRQGAFANAARRIFDRLFA